MTTFVTIAVDGIDFGFDFIDQEIEIEATADSISGAQIKTACRQAEWDQDGIVFPEILDTGNPVVLDPVNNVATAQNNILQGLWRILTLKTAGLFIVTEGNTVRFDTGVDIFASNPTVNAANIVSAFATTVATGGGGGSGPSAAEISDAVLEGAVAGRGTGSLGTTVRELHALQGLESGNPVTNTPTGRTTDDATIDLGLTGDGVSSTTVTRQ